MIEDHGVAVGDAHGVRAAVAVDALTDAEETADVVVRAGERKAVAVKRDAVAGRGLSGDGDVGLGRVTRRLIINDAADIEDHGATGNADGVAEGTGAGVSQRGDVIDGAAATAGGELAESFRTGKGGRLREQRNVKREKAGECKEASGGGA